MNKTIDLSSLNHNRFDFSDIFNDNDLNDEYENEFYDNFDDIQSGKYIIVLNYFNECILLQDEEIKYKLNDLSSRKINKELRKLKVPKQEYIIQDYYDDDCNKYDAILICEIKEDMKYISLDFDNKIYELLSIKNLERLNQIF